jgi:hypothetical protein
VLLFGMTKIETGSVVRCCKNTPEKFPALTTIEHCGNCGVRCFRRDQYPVHADSDLPNPLLVPTKKHH